MDEEGRICDSDKSTNTAVADLRRGTTIYYIQPKVGALGKQPHTFVIVCDGDDCG